MPPLLPLHPATRLFSLHPTPLLVSRRAAGQQGEMDGKVHSFDEHEDSVYGLAWSAVDPWMFASLSYDGRVVLNRVPKSVKYRVLLQ
jgi:hypothetical protein